MHSRAGGPCCSAANGVVCLGSPGEACHSWQTAEGASQPARQIPATAAGLQGVLTNKKPLPSVAFACLQLGTAWPQEVPRAKEPAGTQAWSGRAPWQVAWERNMRRLIALEGGGAGPLQDMFEEAAGAHEAEGITLQQLKVSALDV